MAEGEAALCGPDESEALALEEAEIGSMIQWNGKIAAFDAEVEGAGAVTGDEVCAPTILMAPAPEVVEHEPITLAASAIVGSCGAKLEWESNIDGLLGTGASLVAHGLSVGEHNITLTVLPQPGPGCDEPPAPCSLSVSVNVYPAPLAGALYCGQTWQWWQDRVNAQQAKIFDLRSTNIVHFVGSSLPDLILGNGLANSIFSLEGNDCVYTYDGDDYVRSGSGHDTVYGGEGADKIRGQDGNDTLHGEAGNDDLDGSSGSDFLYGGYGNDNLLGGYQMDFLYGGDGHDRLGGGYDNDILHGDGGEDVLYGGFGDDKLYGDGNNDKLCGERGDDELNGGAANDFCQAGPDEVILGTTSCEVVYKTRTCYHFWDEWTP